MSSLYCTKGRLLMKKMLAKCILIASICTLLFTGVASAHQTSTLQEGKCHTHSWDYDCSVDGHDWYVDDVFYFNYSATKHKKKVWYTCSECYDIKYKTYYKKHVTKWVRDDSWFYYKCKYCERMPKFNGENLFDWNDEDNISIRKGERYTYSMYNYHKSKNRVKSIKRSKKSVCSAKRSGKRIVIKGKKRGRCKVTVKMKSGAKYILRVRVK